MTKYNQVLCDFEYKEGTGGGVYEKIKRSIEKGNLTVVNECVHHFNPHGLSIIFILAESHLSIHTWEEYNKINVDIFTCGNNDPLPVLNSFLNKFEIIEKNIQKITRR